MKLTKRKVFVAALAICLAAIVSMGTLAWFTDSDEVDNKFMVAGSDNANPDEVFSVEVWEDKDNDGEPDDDIDGDDKGLIYDKIQPGDTLPKEVFVKNTGAYDQYIRVIVVVSDAKQWRDVLGLQDSEIPDLDDIVGGFDTDVWTPDYKMSVPSDNTFWYSLYYNTTLPAKENNEIKVFDTVKIPESMTREQAAAFAGGFNVSVLAQAVQTNNVGDTAEKAFATVGLNAEKAYEDFIAKLNS